VDYSHELAQGFIEGVRGQRGKMDVRLDGVKTGTEVLQGLVVFGGKAAIRKLCAADKQARLSRRRLRHRGAWHCGHVALKQYAGMLQFTLVK
jgi:hypothetical protein